MKLREIQARGVEYGRVLADMVDAVVASGVKLQPGESAAMIKATVDALADAAVAIPTTEAQRLKFVSAGMDGFRERLTEHQRVVDGLVALIEMQPESEVRQ